MDKIKLLKEILEELERRGVGIKVNFLDDKFTKQFQAAKDKSILKAIQCTRRAGKSTGEAKEHYSLHLITQKLNTYMVLLHLDQLKILYGICF